MSHTELPVNRILPQLNDALRRQAVVLQAPPGAGKSTALPLYLLEQNPQWRLILVQPRRLAALSIASYLAGCCGESVGQRIGYQIRGDGKHSARTRLLVVTEGVLTRMLQADPELSGFDGVLFDEFHERNLHCDLALALYLESCQLRPQLRLLVMSATLPAAELATWLGSHQCPAEVFEAHGRQYEVSIHYRPLTVQRGTQQVNNAQVAAHVVRTVVEARDNGARRILVFLPGQADIHRVKEQLPTEFEVAALHGGLNLSAQQAAIRVSDAACKVILSTNIAETSLTIDGIDAVIDSGRERQALFRPKYQSTELMTRRISKAAAIQRSGRAGRTQAGVCYRLYSQSDYQAMADYRPADIEQQDLSALVLEIAHWGSEVEALAWFTPPNAGHIQAARTYLSRIGALTSQGVITALGQQLSQYATDIDYARLLLWAQAQSPEQQGLGALLVAHGEEREAEQIDLELALRDVLARPGAYPRTWRRYRYWCGQLTCTPLSGFSSEALMRCALQYKPFGVARQRPDRPGQYILASGAGADLAQPDNSGADYRVVTQISFHQDRANGVIRQSLVVDKDLIETQLAEYLQRSDEVVWRGERQRLACQRTITLGALVLQQRPAPTPPDAQQISAALTAWVGEQGLAVFNWQSEDTQLLHRLRLWAAENDDTRFTDNWLITNLEQWAQPFWTTINDLYSLRRWRPGTALRALLEFTQQQQLDQYFPPRWQAPSGRSHPVNYHADGSAVVQLKLQEVFGIAHSPTVGRQRRPLILELLSPAGRPLQRTSDLAAFWQNGYVAVSKEMRGRYPKHPWPQDPANALATHLTKKALHGQG